MIPALLVPSVRPVASIAGGPISGYIGDTIQLSLRLYLIGGGFTTQSTGVSWSSSNSSIASVSVSGLVTLTGAGSATINATYNGRTYGLAAQSVLPLITDAFTRADNAGSLGTADTGQAWVAQDSTWGIIGNRAYTSAIAGQGVAVITSPWSDCVVQATFSTEDDGIRIVWRDVDTNNYMLFQRESSGTVIGVYSRVAGSFSALGSAGYTFANGDVFAIHLLGNKTIITVNGAPKFSLTNATLQSATKHGLGNTSAISRFGPSFKIARAITRLVTGGDSISSGFNIAANSSWPSTLCQRSGYELFSLINTATAGADIHTDMIGREASDFAYWSTTAPYTNSLYIGWAGTNDIVQDNRTVDQIEPDLWSWFDALAALGVPRNKMAIGTVIPRDSTLNGMAQVIFDARAADLNSRIRANHAPRCGWVIDFAADSRYSSPTAFNGPLYLDKIHPNTPGGVNALADIAHPVVQLMLAA